MNQAKNNTDLPLLSSFKKNKIDREIDSYILLMREPLRWFRRKIGTCDGLKNRKRVYVCHSREQLSSLEEKTVPKLWCSHQYICHVCKHQWEFMKQRLLVPLMHSRDAFFSSNG